MNCNKAYKKLNEYISGSLNKRGIKQIELHASICPKCAKELEFLKKINLLLGEIEPEPEPEGMWDVVKKEVNELHNSPSVLKKAKNFLYFLHGNTFSKQKLAGAFAAILIISLITWGTSFVIDNTTEVATVGNEYLKEYIAVSINDPLSDRVALNMIIAAGERGK